MFAGGKVKYWTVINFSKKSEDAVDRFMYGLVSICNTKGIVCILYFHYVPLLHIIEAQGDYSNIFFFHFFFEGFRISAFDQNVFCNTR